VIKQFNFYDVYGYLLPGIALFALFWMPVGILTQTWPEQDLSKALFLTVLSYIAGHVLQTVANSVVPSTVPGPGKQRRFPSELLLDKSNARFTDAFKTRLAVSVAMKFGLDLKVTLDGNGAGEISTNRQIAFFQARSCLIAKKAEQYAQQFEGLYVMMRGLGCAFCSGAAYFVGWGLSIRRGDSAALNAISTAVLAVTALALLSALVAFFRDSAKRVANRFLSAFLLLASAGSGFVVGAWRFQPVANSTPFPNYPEFILWGGALLALFAAVRCFSAYKGFAFNFAETIWRDFSANLPDAEEPHQNAADGDDE
jgi:drug/metabolite transporter (DMT)-like permease